MTNLLVPSRRRFLVGLFCAPAIIPAARLMRVFPIEPPRFITTREYIDSIMAPWRKECTKLWSHAILYGHASFELNGIGISIVDDAAGEQPHA